MDGILEAAQGELEKRLSTGMGKKHRDWGGCCNGVSKEELANGGKTPTDARDWLVYLLTSSLMLVSESVNGKSVCPPCKSFV